VRTLIQDREERAMEVNNGCLIPNRPHCINASLTIS